MLSGGGTNLKKLSDIALRIRKLHAFPSSFSFHDGFLLTELERCRLILLGERAL